MQTDEEKKQMSEKRRFKKDRGDFKKRLDEQEENEDSDIRTFKFHSLERKPFQQQDKKDGRRERNYDDWSGNKGGHERFDRSGRERYGKKEGRERFDKGGNAKKRFDRNKDRRNNNGYRHDDED